MVYIVRQYPVVRGILVLILGYYILYYLNFNIFNHGRRKESQKGVHVRRNSI